MTPAEFDERCPLCGSTGHTRYRFAGLKAVITVCPKAEDGKVYAHTNREEFIKAAEERIRKAALAIAKGLLK